MRFTPEDLDNTFFLTSDVFSAKENTASLGMVSDTIRPSRTERVEEVVPIRSSVQQNQNQQQENIEERVNSTNTTNEARRQNQETTQQAVTTEYFDEEEILTDEEAVEEEYVIYQRPKPKTQEPLQQEIVESSYVVPEDTSATHFDSVPYFAAIDSTAILDSLNLAKARNKGMSSYNYDSQREGTELPSSLDRSDGVFVLLAVCFLVLAHMFSGGFSYFRDNIMLVFSASKSERLDTQTTSKEIFNTIFLLFLSVLLISISLYEGLDRFLPLEGDEKRPFQTIGLFILLLLLFVFIKLIINKFIGYVFDLGKNVAIWNQSYIVLLSMLGILCFLPTLMLVYSNLWSTPIIGFVLFLFIAVHLILFVRIILFFVGQRFNFLYLIAYLCTVEILPYIFLGIGLIYIYKIDVFNTIL